MSGVEIDKSKKEFTINNAEEMKKIRAKYLEKDEIGRTIKPNFFGHLAREKGFYDSKRKNYKQFDTTMDYLQQIINKYQSQRKDKNEVVGLPISYILDKTDFKKSCIVYSQFRRIVNIVSDYNLEIINVYNSQMENEEKFKIISRLKNERNEYIGNLKIGKSTMIYLVQKSEDKDYKNLSIHILNTLFGYPNTEFYKIVQESKSQLPELVENENGEIEIYGRRYSKIYKNEQKR